MEEAQAKLLDDVRAKIEESLPAIQVDVFRKYVNESEKAKVEVVSLNASYDALNRNHQEAMKELNDLRDLNLRAEDIKGDRATLALDKQKFEIDKQLTEAKLTAEKEKRELVRGMFNDVFRNTTVRRNIMGDIPVKERYTDGSSMVHKEFTDLNESETKE